LAISRSTGASCTIDNVSVREIPGYHATQATAAKRPTYGIHPFGGARNLLTYSEDFGNAVWSVGTVSGAIVVQGAVTITSTNGYGYTRKVVALNDQHSASFNVVSDVDAPGVGIRISDNAGGVTIGRYDFIAGVVQRVQGSRTSVSATFFELGVDMRGGASTQTGFTITFDQAQLEAGATATPYQKVTTQYDVTEAGVPSVHYLSFDGVDDALATPSIDFTATDEMTVFAGVRKLSDAAVANLVELGRNEANTFLINAPLSTGAKDYGALSRGSLVSSAESGAFPAPASNVVSLLAKIGSDEITLRIDGVGFSSAGDQGDGNYSNRPIHIGAQQGSARFLHGHLYGLTVRGALTDDAVVQAVEAVMATKTGVTL